MPCHGPWFGKILDLPLLCCETCLQQESKSSLPLTEAAERWHTETSILYIDINTSLQTRTYTQKAKLTAGMAGAAWLRAWNRCPPAPSEPGHASAMPWCPGLPLGALIHCFHLLPGKWRAEMSKCTGITPRPSPTPSLSVNPSSLTLPSLLHPPTNRLWEEKLYIIGITQCLSLPFKPSHQLSRVCSFQLTDQFCAFSIMMAWRLGGKRWRKLPSTSSLI